MDSMYANKAVGAVLVAGIAFFVSGLLGTVLIKEPPLKQAAIKIEEPQAAQTAAAAPEGPAPIAPLLVSADASAGEAYTKKICIACHNFAKGGPAGVGPNLYGILGAPHGHMAGFNYSTALKSKQGPWTYDELNEWLYKPAAYAPGTRMAFAGITNDQTRANVIAYLRSLSDNPEPLPKPEAAAAKPAQQAAATPAAAAPAAPAGPKPIEPLLASATPAAGEAYTKKICVACHSFNEGGKAGVGPNLYGVVGGPHAHMEGFNYSAALKAKQGPWTVDELNQWLYSPSAYAPGTRMAYAGIKNDKDRADVIAYLNSLSHDPKPLPGADAKSN
jgi:cytochrome c